jgi:hypothetical protein
MGCLKWIGGLLLGCLILGAIMTAYENTTPQARQEQANREALAARWAAYHHAHPNAFPDDMSVLDVAHVQAQALFNDPNDIEWLNERVVDVDPGVACGQVRARNGFGALSLQHYVYVGTVDNTLLFVTDSQDGYGRAYTHYCANRQPLNGEPPRS